MNESFGTPYFKEVIMNTDSLKYKVDKRTNILNIFSVPKEDSIYRKFTICIKNLYTAYSRLLDKDELLEIIRVSKVHGNTSYTFLENISTAVLRYKFDPELTEEVYLKYAT